MFKATCNTSKKLDIEGKIGEAKCFNEVELAASFIRCQIFFFFFGYIKVKIKA